MASPQRVLKHSCNIPRTEDIVQTGRDQSPPPHRQGVDDDSNRRSGNEWRSGNTTPSEVRGGWDTSRKTVFRKSSPWSLCQSPAPRKLRSSHKPLAEKVE